MSVVVVLGNHEPSVVADGREPRRKAQRPIFVGIYEVERVVHSGEEELAPIAAIPPGEAAERRPRATGLRTRRVVPERVHASYGVKDAVHGELRETDDGVRQHGYREPPAGGIPGPRVE